VIINITFTKQPLSPSAAAIFAKFLDAIQDAEEMGGVSNAEDYKNLMARIIYEANSRLEASK
jgi:hypothetical protein